MVMPVYEYRYPDWGGSIIGECMMSVYSSECKNVFCFAYWSHKVRCVYFCFFKTHWYTNKCFQ